MGQSQSNVSSSEDNHEENEDDLKEKPRQKITHRRGGKNCMLRNNDLALQNHVRHPTKSTNGEVNGKATPELQVDQMLEEKNYSERIIREKEMLLKEKEETIRQQAKLIKTQIKLLEQRKLINTPNIGSPKVHYDLIFKPHVMEPPTDNTEFSRFVDRHENVQTYSSDLRNFSPGTSDDDFEKNYFIDRNNVVDAKFPKRQDQTFSVRSPTFTNSKKSVFDIPSHSSTSNTQYSLTNYSSQIPDFKSPPPNLNKLVLQPTPIMQARKYQNNEYRRNNIRKDEQRDNDTKQSTTKLLDDLEKQTSFELQKLNNVQNSYSSNNNIDLKKNVNERKLKPGKSIQGNFKCPGCSASWKSKVSFIGAAQKCRRCGNDVGSKIQDKNSKSDNEYRSQEILISKTEKIADVDD